jgi:site-specific recombinase XerD
MEFKKLIDKYIEFIRNNSYTELSVRRYEYLLNIFYEYITLKNKINNLTLLSYLNGISPDEILSSIEYYMEKVALSEDTVNMYISVIKEFFKYIKETQDIGNDKLIQSFGRGKNDVNSFTYKYKAYIKILLDNNKIKPSTKGVWSVIIKVEAENSPKV